eukprot:6490780-Amphidinium_carterae.2
MLDGDTVKLRRRRLFHLGDIGALKVPPSLRVQSVDSPQKKKMKKKHMEEVEQDVVQHTASRPNWFRGAKLRWLRATTGRRRARRVGSGGTRSSLPTIQEAKACETISADDPDGFERPGLDGRSIFTSTLRAVLGGTQNRGRVFGVPGIVSTGRDLAEDSEKAVLESPRTDAGFLEYQESLLLVVMASCGGARECSLPSRFSNSNSTPVFPLRGT